MHDALWAAMTTGTAWSEGHFIAGDVSLDFANTVYRRWPALGADLLSDAGALAAWLVRAGVLPGGSDEPDVVTGVGLRRARALRALLWAIFDAQMDGGTIPADALSGLLDTARRGSTHVTVGSDGSITASDTPGALAAVALYAIVLVMDPPTQGVRACDRCGWFFIDSSRGRRRRWCSMQTCGNQAKAARHRATHR